MVTPDGLVKILDFGLAKLAAAPSAGELASLASVVTLGAISQQEQERRAVGALRRDALKGCAAGRLPPPGEGRLTGRLPGDIVIPRCRGI